MLILQRSEFPLRKNIEHIFTEKKKSYSEQAWFQSKSEWRNLSSHIKKNTTKGLMARQKICA